MVVVAETVMLLDVCMVPALPVLPKTAFPELMTSDCVGEALVSVSPPFSVTVP